MTHPTRLHRHPLSGHAHRARLFLSLVGQPCEIVAVDLAKGEHRTPDFLRLNPFGQVSVLVDGETVVPDSNAILVYLAKRLGRTDWLPEDAAGAARVQRWLSVAAGPIAFGPAAARLITVFGATNTRSPGASSASSGWASGSSCPTAWKRNRSNVDPGITSMSNVWARRAFRAGHICSP